jgi:hypothetical protein
LPLEATINRICVLVLLGCAYIRSNDMMTGMIVGACLTHIASCVMKYGLKNSFLKPEF